jgi:hypothetical protein
VKLALIVEVPDDFLERRVRDLNEEFPNEPPLSAEALFRLRLEEVADDELALALYSWPIETEVVPMTEPARVVH